MGFGDLILFSKSKIQRICVSSGCTFQIFRGKFYDCWLNARYLFNCVFLSESFVTETTRVFAAYWSSFERPTIVNSEKKPGEPVSFLFFSAYEFFNFFVVFRSFCGCIFFSDCLASRALRFTRKPAKCRICCKQGYLLPCLLYSTHDSFLSVVFDANSCNLHLFSKLFSHKDYWLPGYWLECFLDFCGLYCSHSVLLQKLLTRWTYRKTGFNFSYFPREISWIRFRNLFFLRVSESRFSQNLLVTFRSLFANLKVQTCWILRKSKIPVSHVCDLRHYLLYLCFSPICFVFLWELFCFLKD